MFSRNNPKYLETRVKPAFPVEIPIVYLPIYT